jgi:hypothetical protein
MFDDPQTVLGMVIGLIIIAGGTFLAVRGHLARERREAEDAKL